MTIVSMNGITIQTDLEELARVDLGRPLVVVTGGGT